MTGKDTGPEAVVEVGAVTVKKQLCREGETQQGEALRHPKS
jgi:hypothetical protein